MNSAIGFSTMGIAPNYHVNPHTPEPVKLNSNVNQDNGLDIISKCRIFF